MPQPGEQHESGRGPPQSRTLPRHASFQTDSHRQTAAQEIVALLLASSLVAEERLACAQQSSEEEVTQSAVMRISYGWCVQLCRALWIVLASGEGLLDEAAQAELVRRTRRQIAQQALPKRRQRTGARKVRQPVCQWPRMMQPISMSGDIPVELIPIT